MIMLLFVSQTYFLVNGGENNNKLQTKNRNPRAKRRQTLTHYQPSPASSPRTRAQLRDALLQEASPDRADPPL